MTLTVVNPPGTGVAPEDRECLVTARGGNVCQGYCYPFAALQSSVISDDGVTISAVPGTAGYVWGNIAGGNGALSTDARAGRFGIALTDILDGAQGKVKVKGIVQAKVFNSANTAIAIGNELFVSAKSTGTNVSAASALNALTANSGTEPKKYVGHALEALSSTPSNGTTMTVVFDGWDGIGGGGNG